MVLQQVNKLLATDSVLDVNKQPEGLSEYKILCSGE